MKKFISVLLSMVLTVSLTACGNAGATNAASNTAASTVSVNTTAVTATTGNNTASAGAIQTSGTSAEVKNVVAGALAEIGDMNPYLVSGCKGAWDDCIYQSLGTRDGLGGDMSYVLAKKVTKVDDTTYDIDIYDNIYDSANNHMTADDVVFCYQWMKESGTVSKMGNMDSIKKTGDYSIELHLVKNTVGALEDMLEKNLVTKAAYDAAGGDMTKVTIGTGPYTCKELVSGSSITLVKRDNYWKTDASLLTKSEAANVDQLVIKYISSSNQLAIAMQTGQIDGILYMSGADTDYFVSSDGKAASGYYVYSWKDPNTYQLFYNRGRGRFLGPTPLVPEPSCIVSGSDLQETP